MWSNERFSMTTTTMWSIPLDFGAGSAWAWTGRVAAPASPIAPPAMPAAVPSSSWRRERGMAGERPTPMPVTHGDYQARPMIMGRTARHAGASYRRAHDHLLWVVERATGIEPAWPAWKAGA